MGITSVVIIMGWRRKQEIQDQQQMTIFNQIVSRHHLLVIYFRVFLRSILSSLNFKLHVSAHPGNIDVSQFQPIVLIFLGPQFL